MNLEVVAKRRLKGTSGKRQFEVQKGEVGVVAGMSGGNLVCKFHVGSICCAQKGMVEQMGAKGRAH